ncbi:MAG: 50S ribosomal protein L24 [Candidatus Sericytochromatia bacterium]|nr:50S ribosomal protein L24 [Candidatus Sericytochromatia bacterium]
MHIKKGDTVMVISGRKAAEGGDKGKTGEVLQVFPKDGKAVVQGVNIKTRHVKPSMENPQGGIIKSEAPVHTCKLMVVDPSSGKPTRVGHAVVDGKKVRVAKKSGQVLADNVKVKE